MTHRIVNIVMFLFAFGLSSNICAQTYDVEWEKSYGGTGGDHLHCIKKLSDRGFIAVGFTSSSDGDITQPNKGLMDFWVIKIDNKGVLAWSKTFGGSEIDAATSVAITKDGEYIVAGYTESDNGDVTENHGGSDIWIVKLSNSGNLVWEKCVGGQGLDQGRDIIPTSDGNFLIASRLTRNSNLDMGILKINTDGVILWQKYFGGTGNDEAWSVIQTDDGGYITTGATNSRDGDVTGNYGDGGFWILKLNGLGGLEWQKYYGGVDYFGSSNSVVQLVDKGFLITGHMFQKFPFTGGTNDISNYHGNWDVWCLKLNLSGDIVWQNTPGIRLYDWSNEAISIVDGGAIVVGGKVGQNNDYWIFKLNAIGNVDWQLSLGGSKSEEAYGIESDDCGYIICGGSTSKDGQVSNNKGGQDGWLVKLSPKTYSANVAASTSSHICPGQPVTFRVTLTSNPINPSYQWRKNGIDVGANSEHYTDNSLIDADQISVIVKNDCQMVESNQVTVNVTTFSIDAMTSPIEISSGQSFVISTSANQSYKVLAWEPVSLFPLQTASSQNVKLEKSTQIKISAISDSGCADDIIYR